MGVMSPLNLLWLEALAMIVIVWLIKPKPVRRQVSANFLWLQAAQQLHSEKWSRKLQRHLVFYLQLALVSLMVLALARPYIPGTALQAPEILVLVDTSASMTSWRDTTYQQQRLQWGIEQVLTRLNKLPFTTRVMVASCNRDVQVLVPFTTDHNLVKKTLRSLQAQHMPGSPGYARSFVQAILAGHSHCQVLVVTDQQKGWPLNARVNTVDCCGQTDNLGICFLAASTNTQRQAQIRLGIFNSSDLKQTAEVTIHIGKQLRTTRQVMCPAQARQVYDFTNLGPLPDSSQSLVQVQLSGNDLLPCDNTAYLSWPIQELLPVQIPNSGNLFAEQALQAVLPHPAAILNSQDSTSPAIRLFEKRAPWPLPPGINIVLSPPDCLVGAPLPQGYHRLSPGSSQLANKIDFSEVVVSHLINLNLPEYSQIIATAGKRPAIVALCQPDSLSLVLAFDIYKSNLPLSPSWPLVVSNLIEQAPNYLGGINTPSLSCGDSLTIPIPSQTKQLTLEKPDGQSLPIKSEQSQLTIGITDQCGMFSVVDSLKPDSASLKTFAVSLLNQNETDLRARPLEPGPGADKSAASSPSQSSGPLECWPHLLLVVLGLLLTEWYYSHRRPA